MSGRERDRSATTHRDKSKTPAAPPCSPVNTLPPTTHSITTVAPFDTNKQSSEQCSSTANTSCKTTPSQECSCRHQCIDIFSLCGYSNPNIGDSFNEVKASFASNIADTAREMSPQLRASNNKQLFFCYYIMPVCT